MNCYVVRAGIFLITAVSIAGVVGCDGCSPPASQNLEIQTWYDLDAIRNNLRGHHILMSDLDSTTAGYAELAGPRADGGEGWEPIGWGYWGGGQVLGGIFKGSFDGQGHEIRDLFINRPDDSEVGLFGFVDEGGIIKNINVVNATVTSGEGMGGLAGFNDGTVRTLIGTLGPGAAVGLLVGHNRGAVCNSYACGSVTGEWAVGGLVGFNEGTVSNSYCRGNVTARDAIGGLVGYNQGTVIDSYSRGTVTGNWTVGGLLGGNSGTVTNSYCNYDEVLINGENVITIGTLFGEDFEEWLDNDKFLDVNERLPKENGYYVINNVTDFKELLAFGQNSSLKFRLKQDLDLAIGSNCYVPYFAGEFDGNGHKISNLSFNFSFVSQVGLFGYLASSGNVTQVIAETVNMTGYWGVGGLVGVNWGTVGNSYVTGNVTGNKDVGGLVGQNCGTVSNSYSTGAVAGGSYVGGLVGLTDGTVTNSNASGTVTSSYVAGGVVGLNDGTVSNAYYAGNVTGNWSVGGLVGLNYGAVSNSCSTGSVTGDGNVGGLVGLTDGTVSDSYSCGNVTGDYHVGGLLGGNRGTVSHSYSIGSVAGHSDVGGLVGWNEDGTVRKSFWDTETSGRATSAGGIGKTTVEMKNVDTFSDAGWNIIAVANPDTRNPAYIWNIVNGVTYPFLRWQD